MLLNLACFILVVTCATAAESPFSQVKANRYVDDLLSGFPNFARQTGLDPLPLPESKVGFSKKGLLVTWKGSASLSGSARGISTLHRSGDFIIGLQGSRGFIDGTSIGLNNMKASFTGRASFMKIKVKLSASAKVSTIRIRLRVSCNLAPGAVAQLDNFNISQLSRISITVGGLGPLRWVLSKVVSGLTNAFRGKIVKAIEGPARKVIASQVKKIAFPRI